MGREEGIVYGREMTDRIGTRWMDIIVTMSISSLEFEIVFKAIV